MLDTLVRVGYPGPVGVEECVARYCGREFTGSELERIQALIAENPSLNRAALSRLVCDALGWRRANGGRKDMSCRVAMLRMERDGLLRLPPPERGNGNGRNRPRLTAASDPGEPITSGAGALGELSLRSVATARQSALWNELIERYHYLGYKPLPGAQLRYMVFAGSELLALLGFGAAAWKVAPRDHFIGWSVEQRVENLQRVVNNARFLILPWVRSRNLASRVLAVATRRLPQEWLQRYGYQPLLLETFVDRTRFEGTCYRAANWLRVGQTRGRGKLDRQHRYGLPVKDVWLYPLHRRFRSVLCRSR